MMIFIVAIAFLFAGFSSECMGLPAEIQSENSPNKIRFLGTVDGRSYYGEINQLLTWYEAKKYCEELGYQLGSIDTRNQTLFVRARLFNDFGSYYFWTSAHDDHTINGLVWDDTDNKPDTEAGFTWESNMGTRDYLQCGVVDAQRNGDLILHGASCTQESYILCQSESETS